MGDKCETDRIFRGFYLKKKFIHEIYNGKEKKQFGNKTVKNTRSSYREN